MRVRSGLQRFPVAQWVEDLETLQSRSIAAHTKPTFSMGSIINFGLENFSRHTTPATTTVNTPAGTAPNSAVPTRANSVVNSPFQTPIQSRAGSRVNSPAHSPVQSRAPSPVPEDEGFNQKEGGQGSSSRAGQAVPPRRGSRLRSVQSSRNVSSISRDGSFASLHAALEGALPADGAAAEAIPENEEDHSHDTVSPRNSHWDQSQSDETPYPPFPSPFDRRVNSYSRRPATEPSTPSSPIATPSPSRPSTPPPGPDGHPFGINSSRSVLSLQAIVGEQTNFNLQKVDPFFTDPAGEYFNNFERSLEGVTAKNSEGKFCIEKFLEKSEKDWFAQRHNAKLGKSALSSPASSIFRMPRAVVRSVTDGSDNGSEDRRRESDSEAGLTQFGLGQDFVPFKGLKRIMQLKIGDWQIYTILLAFVSFRLSEN